MNFLLGLLVSISGWLASSLFNLKYKKLLPYLHQVFLIVDPIIKANLPRMSSSDIYRLVEKVVISVADEKLSAKEITELVMLTLNLFKVNVAADAKAAVPFSDSPIMDQLDEVLKNLRK